jgi:curved DNA-binding protein CbpA
MDTNLKNYYTELGVESSATEAEIKAAYYALVKTLHPDVNGGDAAKTERYTLIVRIYEVLSDPTRRAHYDTCGMDLSEAERKEKAQIMLRDLIFVVIDQTDSEDKIIELAQKAIDKQIANVYTNCRAAIARKEKYEKALKRIRYIGEGISPVIVGIKNTIGRLEMDINVCKANLILFNETKEAMKEYQLVDAVPKLNA